MKSCMSATANFKNSQNISDDSITKHIIRSGLLTYIIFTHPQVGPAFGPSPILLVEFAFVRLIQLPIWNQNSSWQSTQKKLNK